MLEGEDAGRGGGGGQWGSMTVLEIAVLRGTRGVADSGNTQEEVQGDGVPWVLVVNATAGQTEVAAANCDDSFHENLTSDFSLASMSRMT